MLVVGPAQLLSALLGGGDLFMATEAGTTIDSFWRCKDVPEYGATVARLLERYPHAGRQTFNSAFVLFRPAAIPAGTPERLVEIQAEAEPANRPSLGGTDQQIINLLLWPMARKIPGKLVCFWGLGEPQNDVASEYRGWVGGEIPVALHYTRWYAPWLVKAPDAGAYAIHRLNRTCLDAYTAALAQFDGRFPVVSRA